MSVGFLEVSSESSVNLEEVFKSLSQKICMMLATEGVYRKPYMDGLPLFSALPLEKKQEIVQSLTFYKELCEEQISEGYKLKDNSTFTWRAFRKLGFIPRADVFNHMSDENLVEIYSSDSKQLYRNFRFFECCSYSLEELHSLEWWNLYERDSNATMLFFQDAAKIFSGEISESYVPGIPPTRLKEIRSQENNVFLQEVKLLSPLKRNKRVEGLLVVGVAELVNN